MGYLDSAIIYSFPDGTKLLEDTQVAPNPHPMDTTHIIEEGDNLIDLSTRAYGDPNNWIIIAKFNNLIDPWDLIIGKVLILPSI